MQTFLDFIIYFSFILAVIIYFALQKEKKTDQQHTNVKQQKKWKIPISIEKAQSKTKQNITEEMLEIKDKKSTQNEIKKDAVISLDQTEKNEKQGRILKDIDKKEPVPAEIKQLAAEKKKRKWGKWQKRLIEAEIFSKDNF